MDESAIERAVRNFFACLSVVTLFVIGIAGAVCIYLAMTCLFQASESKAMVYMMLYLFVWPIIELKDVASIVDIYGL